VFFVNDPKNFVNSMVFFVNEFLPPLIEVPACTFLTHWYYKF